MTKLEREQKKAEKLQERIRKQSERLAAQRDLIEEIKQEDENNPEVSAFASVIARSQADQEEEKDQVNPLN